MPALKSSATEQMNREVRAAVNAGQERRSLNDERTAKMLGISKGTYQRHKRAPEGINLGEFRKMIKVLKLQDTDVLRMLREE
mgnify:CR=1 FL=1